MRAKPRRSDLFAKRALGEAVEPGRGRVRTSNCGHAGFSLLELLIAITILGFILTLLFSAFRLAQQSWDRTEQRIDKNGQMYAGRAFLENLITQSYPFRWKSAQLPGIAFSGEPERLSLIAELPPFLGGGLQQVFLEVVPLENEDGQFRLLFRYAPLRSDSKGFDSENLSEEKVVIEKTGKINFSFYGRDPAKPIPSEIDPAQWHDVWRDSNHMPALVRIHIDHTPAWPDIYAKPIIGQEGGCQWDDFHKRCR